MIDAPIHDIGTIIRIILVRLSALSWYDYEHSWNGYPHSWYGYSQESDRAMLERNRSQSIEVPSASADGPAAPTSVHALREAKVRHADRSGHRVATASPAAAAAGGRTGRLGAACQGRPWVLARVSAA
jgi:hypothetical protein